MLNNPGLTTDVLDSTVRAKRSEMTMRREKESSSGAGHALVAAGASRGSGGVQAGLNPRRCGGPLQEPTHHCDIHGAIFHDNTTCQRQPRPRTPSWSWGGGRYSLFVRCDARKVGGYRPRHERPKAS